jgi:hypothetical protein
MVGGPDPEAVPFLAGHGRSKTGTGKTNAGSFFRRQQTGQLQQPELYSSCPALLGYHLGGPFQGGVRGAGGQGQERLLVVLVAQGFHKPLVKGLFWRLFLQESLEPGAFAQETGIARPV